MFKVMLDVKLYQSKPTTEELKRYINKRLMKYPVNVTAEQLALELTSGKTFVPAYLGTKNSKGYRARQKECWTNQQVMCLDFDNQIYIKNPEYPDKSDEKKIPIKKVTMTWDMAKAEFKDTAMFMYKSFGNIDGDPEKEGHPKFRVVFAFDSVIENRSLYLGNANALLERYPCADQSSVQENRLFYGGTQLYVFNYNNRIPVDSNKIHLGGFYDRNTLVNKQKHNIGAEDPPTEPKHQLQPIKINNNNKFNHIQLLKNKDKYFAKLTGMEFEEVTFSTRGEVYDYLKRINLHDFLGIQDKTLHDIFHEDRNKSASIFQSHNTGYWFYNCFSESNPFYGSIIDVTERITGLSKSKNLRYLMEIFKIKLEKTEWQIEQEENIQLNLDFIKDHDNYLATAYPFLHSIISRSELYFQVIREFHEIGLDIIQKLIKIDDHESGVFYASIKHIMKRMYGASIENDKFRIAKEKRVRTAIALLVYLRILDRHELTTLPDVYAERAREAAKLKKYKHTVEFYSIPSYDATLMVEVEKIAKRFKEIGMTVGNFGRQMVLQSCGKEEADRCFPNRKEDKIAALNIKTCEEIEKVLLKYIEEYGWVTEDRIIQNVPLDIDVEQEMRKRNKKIKHTDIISIEDKEKWLQNYKRNQLKKMLGGILVKHKFAREHLSNKLMECKGIPMHYSENGNPSYPVIIYKNK